MRPLAPGMRLGSFRLEARLGGGQGGEVWRVSGPDDTTLALKARPRRAPDAAGFRREFERLRTLRLPAVVRVRGLGEDGGYLFFTMDLAEGIPFDDFVRAGETPSGRLRRAAIAGASIATALTGIHRLGLAHRDLNPSNILIRDDGLPTLLDFGDDSRGAGGRVRVGTAAFMAPEVRLGQPSDHRADSYALGVMLYEALAGRPKPCPPGRPRPPLALDPTIPLALSHLIDCALSLDPMQRPECEELAAVLSAVAEGHPLPPAPWPEPRAYTGDTSALLAGSAVIHGVPGSGRRRLVGEGRYQWYRRGYRSIAGAARPDQALGALRALVAALLAGLTPEEQRTRLGGEATILSPLLPDAVPRPPDPLALGRALAAVFARAAPLVVIIWDADEADPGTAAVLPILASALPSDVRLWVTARRPLPGLRPLSPPPWSPQSEAAVLSEVLPDNVRLPAPAAILPLESSARAWRILASLRGEQGPAHPVPESLEVLSLLDAPFPLPLAELLTDGTLRSLIEAGHIETDGAQAWLVDTGTLRLAAARCADPTAQHARIAAQWSQLPPARQDAAAIARHTLRAGLPAGTALQAAAQAALRAGVPAEADRWLQLLDLTAPGSVDFLTDVAHAWAALSQRPEDVDPKSIAQLRERAADAEQEAMAEALALMFLARRGDRSEAVVTGKALAARFSEPMPHLAAEILREVAAAELAMGQARGAVVSGREALALVEQPVPSRRDVEIADTLAAALLADSRPAEAVGLCSQLAARCFGAKLWWGEATARVWLGRGQLCLGLRAEAADNTARAQRLQPRHSDPALLARSKLLQARLAIERGDLRTGRADLDVARSTARALGAEEVLSEACALSLDVALHLADPEEARLAIADHAALSRPGRTDHWPAALGRWLWLSGDLHGALEAVRVSPEGHGALCVRAEQSRLLLVSGRYDEASRAAGALARRASSLDMEELALFGRLVAGAAIGARDTRYLPLLVRIDRSRWIHLHLGGLHFDAIRRRIRGEDVTAILRTLQGRAERIQHRLYLALSQPEGW